MKKTRRNRDYNNPDPEHYVSTRSLMPMFHMKDNNCLVKLLHLHKVRFKCGFPNSYVWFWNKEDVEQILNSRPRPVETIPDGWIGSSEAMKILGMSLDSIRTKAKRGRIRTYRVLLTSVKMGHKTRVLFNKQDVLSLKTCYN